MDEMKDETQDVTKPAGEMLTDEDVQAVAGGVCATGQHIKKVVLTYRGVDEGTFGDGSV
jgi:hypothetical protein